MESIDVYKKCDENNERKLLNWCPRKEMENKNNASETQSTVPGPHNLFKIDGQYIYVFVYIKVTAIGIWWTLELKNRTLEKNVDEKGYHNHNNKFLGKEKVTKIKTIDCEDTFYDEEKKGFVLGNKDNNIYDDIINIYDLAKRRTDIVETNNNQEEHFKYLPNEIGQKTKAFIVIKLAKNMNENNMDNIETILSEKEKNKRHKMNKKAYTLKRTNTKNKVQNNNNKEEKKERWSIAIDQAKYSPGIREG